MQDHDRIVRMRIRCECCGESVDVPCGTEWFICERGNEVRRVKDSDVTVIMSVENTRKGVV